MRIDRHVLALEAVQEIATHEYAEPLCVHTALAQPALWMRVEPELPVVMRRVRIVQQSCGPVQAPEWGTPPDNVGFRYVGTAWHSAYAWHVFVEV